MKYEVDTFPGIRVPVDEETSLAGDLYRPRTAEPVPGIVTFHYGRRTLGVRCFRFFAEAGFATLVVDCRGIGESDGMPREPLDPREGEDGAAIISWLAGQPWCTGEIGMWGFSGGAALTLLTASRRPPELKAIVPVMGFTSWERDLVHPGGIRGGIGFYMLPCIEKMLNDFLPPMLGPDLEVRRKVWRERAEVMDSWIADAWRHGPGDPDWRPRDVDTSTIAAPALCIGGWLDLCRATMLDTYRKIAAPKSLVVGPWLHDLPENAALAPVESLPMARDWFGGWLRGSGSETGVRVYVQGENRWAGPETWPPPARRVTFSAAPGRGLVPGAAEVVVSRLTDPTAGLLGGLWTMPISDLGYPLDQHDDDQRSLSFSTAPLAEPLRITGTALVTLELADVSTVRRCVAKLADVDEQGRSTVIANGLSAEPGQPITLDPSCHTVLPGHRLRLVLSDGDFPRLWPAPAREVLGIRAARVELSISDTLPPAERPYPTPARDRGMLKFAQRPVWRISRDHVAEGVTLELSANQRRLYTPDGARISERTFGATARVGMDDPASASMTVHAGFRLESEEGEEVVVRAGIAIDGAEGVATAETLIDERPVVQREWHLG